MHKIEYCTFYLINSFIGGRRIILLCENPSGSLLMLLHKCIEPIIYLFQVCGYGQMQKASFMDITFQVCATLRWIFGVYCRGKGLVDAFIIVASGVVILFLYLSLGLREKDQGWVLARKTIDAFFFLLCKSFMLLFSPDPLSTQSLVIIFNKIK